MNVLRRHKDANPPGELRDVFAPGGIALRDRAVSNEERRRLLDDRVQQNIVRGGARVESRGDYEAVLIQGRRPNHVLHLLLTLVTFGVWGLVWIVVAVVSGEKRALLTVDEFGCVDVRPLGR